MKKENYGSGYKILHIRYFIHNWSLETQLKKPLFNI